MAIQNMKYTVKLVLLWHETCYHGNETKILIHMALSENAFLPIKEGFIYMACFICCMIFAQIYNSCVLSSQCPFCFLIQSYWSDS